MALLFHKEIVILIWALFDAYLKNNKKFWIEKIEENISRDKRNDSLLNNMGWIPLHFWSKDVENNLDECIKEILEYVSYQTIGKTIE